MKVVLLLWRSPMRSSWRTETVLIMRIGLGGAVPLAVAAVAAGARRTSSANDAILRISRASDVGTSFRTENPDIIQQRLSKVADVAAAEVWVGFFGRPQSVDPAGMTAILGFWSDQPQVERPILTSGRFPTGESEAFLNERAAARSGLGVGSSLSLTLAARAFQDFVTVDVDIVGIGLLPPTIGQPGADTPKLGVGILAERRALNLTKSSNASAIVLFDLADSFGTDDLIHLFPQGLPVQHGTPTEWFTSAPPAEVSQAEAARNVVWIGLALLAAAIVGTVIHTLLVAVRQRRREYAVLKAIGFTRSQVRTSVVWQSGAIVGLALAAALPTGVAGGRWLWTAFAEDQGIVVGPAVPLLLLGWSALAITVLVQGTALLPASLARRTPLAQTLPSE